MKKDKSQHPGKTAKKQIKDAVQKKLAQALKKITVELNGPVDIDIEKESKKLAKKIVKHLTIGAEPAENATAVVSKAKPAKASPKVIGNTSAAKPAKAPAPKIPKQTSAKPAKAVNKLAGKSAIVKVQAKNGAVKTVAAKEAKK